MNSESRLATPITVCEADDDLRVVSASCSSGEQESTMGLVLPPRSKN